MHHTAHIQAARAPEEAAKTGGQTADKVADQAPITAAASLCTNAASAASDFHIPGSASSTQLTAQLELQTASCTLYEGPAAGFSTQVPATSRWQAMFRSRRQCRWCCSGICRQLMFHVIPDCWYSPCDGQPEALLRAMQAASVCFVVG